MVARDMPAASAMRSSVVSGSPQRAMAAAVASTRAASMEIA
jgi:hypothetical protein